MARSTSGPVRAQTLGEELMNAITHGVGALLAVAGTVLLIVRAARHGGAINVVSVALFGASMIVLYTISCLYHALKRGRGKRVFQVLDHCSIFLLIFGTYIPLCLVTVGGAFGWTLFGVMGGCAVVGVVLNAVDLARWKRLSQVLYLVMGWMGVIALPTLFRELTGLGFLLLVLGGVAYTVGVIFYRNKEKRFWHGVWHFFVLAGTVLHFFAVYMNCCF